MEWKQKGAVKGRRPSCSLTLDLLCDGRDLEGGPLHLGHQAVVVRWMQVLQHRLKCSVMARLRDSQD